MYGPTIAVFGIAHELAQVEYPAHDNPHLLRMHCLLVQLRSMNSTLHPDKACSTLKPRVVKERLLVAQ